MQHQFNKLKMLRPKISTQAQKSPREQLTRPHKRAQLAAKREGNHTKAYLGHWRTPSSASLDSGGFRSTLIPSFSVAIVSALIRNRSNLGSLHFSCARVARAGKRTPENGIGAVRAALAMVLNEQQKLPEAETKSNIIVFLPFLCSNSITLQFT